MSPLGSPTRHYIMLMISFICMDTFKHMTKKEEEEMRRNEINDKGKYTYSNLYKTYPYIYIY
jgi:hypothetical protein